MDVNSTQISTGADYRALILLTKIFRIIMIKHASFSVFYKQKNSFFLMILFC